MNMDRPLFGRSQPSSDLDLSQAPYRCKLEWGPDGAARASARGDVVIVVDVFRFSTAVAVAVDRGGLVFPCAPSTNIDAYAEHVAAIVGPAGVAALSPAAYDGAHAGMRIVIPSPNGAVCCLIAASAPAMLTGSIVNARATAVAAMAAADDQYDITVVACGELPDPPHEEGAVRFAIEDFLGAGAILSVLDGSKSPEAEVCEAAFHGARDRLPDLLLDSISGRELRKKNREVDVIFSAQLDRLGSGAILKGDYLAPF